MSSDIRNLLVVLSIGLIHGLVYVFIIPPWQHYDEPNHFEFAWLVSDRNTLPADNDIDHQLRADVARSMIEHGFFRELGFLPDLSNPDRPAWIGPISQLSNPPLYYLIASIPLRFIQAWDMGNQLIAARLVSLGFYLLTIFAAWGIMIEITREDHPLRLYLPATLALLPGYVDVMTAVNNDSAAIALFSLCLWGCLHLVIHGIGFLSLVGTVAATVLCLLTKETAFVALPLFAFAFLLTIFRERFRWVAWVSIAVASIVGILLVLSRGDALYWFRSTSQPESTRVENPQAIVGESVFQISTSAVITPRWSEPIFQPIPVSSHAPNDESTYTVGSWIWADKPSAVNAPTLGNGQSIYSPKVEVGVEPTFFAYTATFPVTQGTRLWISLDPGLKDEENTVYYDGLVLVDGGMDLSYQPVFFDDNAVAGTWGDSDFRNLLRNGSAEVNGWRVAFWLDSLGARFLPDQTRPSALMTYFLDWKSVLWHYRLTAERLFRTFWAQFGWGHVTLVGSKPYRPLALVSILGLAGFVIWFVHSILTKRKMRWDLIFLFALVMLIVWGGAISRGVLYLGNNRLYLPVARYAYPAIIPTLLVLCLGWQAFFSWIRRWEKAGALVPYLQMVIWFGFFAYLAVHSIVSILSYYGYAGSG
jgi:hypothetical protein